MVYFVVFCAICYNLDSLKDVDRTPFRNLGNFIEE